METGQKAVTEDERKTQSGKNLLGGGVAMKISRNLAAIGAMVLLPMQGLMAQLQNTTDFMEIACAPTSSLSTLMEERDTTSNVSTSRPASTWSHQKEPGC